MRTLSTRLRLTPPLWSDYETKKRQHLNAETLCKQQGVAFLPFVVEAHGGGFGPVARREIGFLAQAGASRGTEDVEVTAEHLLRCMSVVW